MHNISYLREGIEGFVSRANSERCGKHSNCDDIRIIEFDCVEEAQNIGAMRDSFFYHIKISGILEYMDLGEQFAFMKECRRILAEGGFLKILVPIIRDIMLVDYYGWNIDDYVSAQERASKLDEVYSRNPPKYSFTPSSITSLARNAGLLVTGASLSNIYFYEIILKINQNLHYLNSIEIAHNIFYSVANRIGTASELEYWSNCLDQGMEIEEMINKLSISSRDFREIFHGVSVNL